ncbi:MAG: hypothetical protein IJN67_13290 [Oscillospiraceae bacterium]|nr:hypothetical protein [Oscillospiraceae bacterium]
MAKKNNIRSIRFSDEMMEMIESQAGDSFTAKFEALVTRCMWELPRKEEELRQIQTQIENERKNLRLIRDRKSRLESNLAFLERGTANLRDQINRTVKELESM